MISPRDKLDRARSARRLVLLATGASFAVAGLLLGPGGSGQSMLPTASTANAKESAPQAGRGWIGVQIQPSSQNNTASGGPTKATCLRPKPFRPTAAHATYRYLGHIRPAQLRRRCCCGI